MSDLQQEFDEELSRLLREYQDRGLSFEEMIESLDWHYDLALVRQSKQQDSTDPDIRA